MSMDIRRHGCTYEAETGMHASESMAEADASTCSDAHASADAAMEMAQDANDIVSSQFCTLRVADFPVDSNGLAMWPRADLPIAHRARRFSKPAKRVCPDSEESGSDCDHDEEVNKEGEFSEFSKKPKSGSSSDSSV
jgi:hypothetical protein